MRKLDRRWLSYLPLVLLVLFSLTVFILAIIGSGTIKDTPVLVLVLNIVFISCTSFLAAGITASVFIRTGLWRFLALSSASFIFGFAALVAGLVLGSYGPNANATVFNTGALIAAIAHILVAALTGRTGLKRQALPKRYYLLVIAVVIGWLAVTSTAVLVSRGMTPLFFIQGQGSTPLREVVLGLSVILFGATSLYFYQSHRETRQKSTYWYALGLGTIAIGLVAVLLQKTFGTPLNWVGRAAQYTGSIEILLAAIVAVRESRTKDLGIEEVAATLFQEPGSNYRLIIETDPNPIILLNPQGRILLWSHQAENLFGYSAEEAMGTDLSKLVLPAYHDYLNLTIQQLQQRAGNEPVHKTANLEARAKDGTMIPVEFSIAGKNTRRGWMGVAVLNDIRQFKLTENELRKSEERFRLVAEASHTMVYERIFGTGQIVTRKGVKELLGYEPQEVEFTLKWWQNGIHPDDVPLFEKWQHGFSASDRNHSSIYRVRHKQGHYIIVEDKAQVICDEDGKAVCVVGGVTDVTERIRSEEALKKSRDELEAKVKERTAALRESETEFRKIVETANEGVWITEPEGKIIFINDRISEIFGYSKEEITGHFGPEFLVEGQLDYILDLRDRLHKGQKTICELQFLHKNGFPVWVQSSASPLFDSEGRHIRNLHMLTDITERKRVQEALTKSEEQYRRIVETANEGIWITTPQGLTTFVNKRVCESLGYSNEELLGKTAIDLLEKDQAPMIMKIREDLAAGLRVVTEYQLRRKDGSFLYTLCSASPLLDETGRHFANLFMHTDITERKRVEEELKKVPRRVFEAQENERRNIARELHDQTGQYLTALKMLLGRMKKASPEANAPLDEAYSLAGELLAQVRDLSLSLRPSMLDDMGLLPTLIWHFERYTVQSGIRVDFKHAGISEGLPSQINTVAYRIIQEALTNVTRYAGVKQVKVLVQSNGDKLLIKVDDEGKGFNLAEAAASASNGISGMRERVALAGGTLKIVTFPGKGTHLTAEIPLR